MADNTKSILVVVFLSAFTVLGDYFLKLASQNERPFTTKYFLAGAMTYTSGAFGWVWVMRHLKLSHIGVVFSVSTVLFLGLLGILGFQERLRGTESLGIALGVASLILLGRRA